MSARAARARRATKKAPRRAKKGGPGNRDHGAHAQAHSHGAAHEHPGAPAHDHDHDHPGPGAAPRRASAATSQSGLSRAANAAQAHRQPLPQGAGEGKLLFFDAASGIAGDMTIAALVDLGVPLSVVERAIAALPLRGVRLRLERAQAGAIGASRFEAEVRGRQPERRYRDIDAMLARAKLDSAIARLARAIFRRLGEAEAEVHRIPVDEVHFHEVGAVDSIVDVVGAAACIAHLGAEVLGSPLPLGRGFVTSRHGVIPLPAPATVGVLKGVPTYDAGIEGELVTPTGAAIIATSARRFLPWPSFEPERIGWGAGTSALADRPNALRVVLGRPTAKKADEPGGPATHVVVEATVDDMTGEAAGHAIAALLAAGALDAWAAPVVMKKGRPGLVVSALAGASASPRVLETMLRETSSIGVRYTEVRRIERPRAMHTVATRYGDISVKVSGGPYGASVVKPEFDACAEAAERAGVPVRVVIEEALLAARSIGTL